MMLSGSKKVKPMWVDCYECPLALCRKRPVLPRGGFECRIMIVGEAPGADEENVGAAFVGRSGKLLDKWLESIDLSECDVYVTNVVKCRPPHNRTPTDFEIEGCLPHLAREIQELKPRIIVTLGSTARAWLPTCEAERVHIKHPAWWLRKGGWPTVELKCLADTLEECRRREYGRL